MKDSFIVFNEHWAGMKALDFEQRGRLLTALMSWNGSTDMPDLDPITQVVFDMMLPRMQACKDRYEETVEKRREAGRKGGNAKHAKATDNASDTPKQSQAMPSNAEQAGTSASKAKQSQAMPSNVYHTDTDTDPDTENTTCSITPQTPQGGHGADAPVGLPGQGSTQSVEEASTDAPATAKPKPKLPSMRPNDFLAWYEAYPRKRSRDEAVKAWDAACREKRLPDLQTLLDALGWQRKQHDWVKEGGKYVPHPASYLRKGSWQDEKPAPVRPSYAPDERGRTRYVREDEMDFDSTPMTPNGEIDWIAVFDRGKEAQHV